jgi:CsoR family transcriptional regulator, copper-sensing transcriptional repressor
MPAQGEHMKKDKKFRKIDNGIDHSDDIKRLNRIVGQIEGISRMLENNRKLDEVITQCKAIHAGLKAVENRVIRAHVSKVLDELENTGKRKDREEVIDELEKLYRMN